MVEKSRPWSFSQSGSITISCSWVFRGHCSNTSRRNSQNKRLLAPQFRPLSTSQFHEFHRCDKCKCSFLKMGQSHSWTPRDAKTKLAVRSWTHHISASILRVVCWLCYGSYTCVWIPLSFTQPDLLKNASQNLIQQHPINFRRFPLLRVEVPLPFIDDGWVYAQL